jgi:hypothetical protein
MDQTSAECLPPQQLAVKLNKVNRSKNCRILEFSLKISAIMKGLLNIVVQAEVGVGDVEVPSALVETEPEGAAADVFVGEVLQQRRLGPAADIWDQRGDVVAKVAHRAPSQTTTRPCRARALADRTPRSRAPAPRRHRAAPRRRRAAVSRRRPGGQRGAPRNPGSPHRSGSVPQNAASAAVTAPGDAIPSRHVFSSHLGFSAAARSKRALQLEGLGMVVSLSEGSSSLRSCCGCFVS